MRRNLNRMYKYNTTVFSGRSYFRMTRETCELFTHEFMPTERIPLGNGSGPAPIPPTEQVLYTFLWRMADQEPTRAVSARFDITVIVWIEFWRVSQAAVDLSGRFIRWLNGECHWQNIIQPKDKFVESLEWQPCWLCRFRPWRNWARAGMVEWNGIVRLFRFSGILG